MATDQDKNLLTVDEFITPKLPDIGGNEEEIVNAVTALFNQARTFKVEHLQLHTRWENYQHFREGHQWESERAEFLSMPVTNFILSNVETIKAITIQNKPVLDIEADDIEVANKLREIIDYNMWYRLRIPKHRKLAVSDMIELGNGFLKLFYDPTLDVGRGDIRLDYADPYTIFPQPMQPNLQDCRYFFQAFPVYISELIEIYGEKAEDIKPEDALAIIKKQDPEDMRSNVTGTRSRASNAPFVGRGEVLSPVTSTDGSQTDQFDGRTGVSKTISKEIGRALLMEMWIKDDRTIPNKQNPEAAISENEVILSTQQLPSVRFEDDHKAHMKEHQGLLDNLDSNIEEINTQLVALGGQELSPEQIELVQSRTKKHIDDHALWPVQKERLKYPGGRVITVAGNKVLDDKPNPYDHQKWPFIHYKNYEHGDSFWAEGEIKYMISPQKIHNRMEALLTDAAILTGNPHWVAQEDANVEINDITNMPGSIIEAADINGIRREHPPPMPTYILEMMQLEKQHVEIVSGVYDVTQGRKPSGITAARAIESLQEAGRTRINPKTEQVISSDHDLYMQMIKLMGQFYTEETIFRQIGADGTVNTIKLKPEMFEDDFLVRIRPRDEIGATPEGRMNIGLILLEAGAITPDLLVEYINLPGFEGIVQKMRERQQQLPPAEETEGNKGNGQGIQNRTGQLLGRQREGSQRS